MDSVGRMSRERSKTSDTNMQKRENVFLEGASDKVASNDVKPSTTPPPLIYLEGELLDLDPDVPEIHKAVFEGDLERVKALVEAGADINERNPEGWPPLHTAIKTGNMPCAAYLIKCGASDFYDRQQAEYSRRLNMCTRVSARKQGGSF